MLSAQQCPNSFFNCLLEFFVGARLVSLSVTLKRQQSQSGRGALVLNITTQPVGGLARDNRGTVTSA